MFNLKSFRLDLKEFRPWPLSITLNHTLVHPQITPNLLIFPKIRKYRTESDWWKLYDSEVALKRFELELTLEHIIYFIPNMVIIYKINKFVEVVSDR